MAHDIRDPTRGAMGPFLLSVSYGLLIRKGLRLIAEGPNSNGFHPNQTSKAFILEGWNQNLSSNSNVWDAKLEGFKGRAR